MKQARVTAKVRQNEKTIAARTYTMSTDLPAEKLGELVSDVLQQAWREGNDPTHGHVVIYFT
jgi:hypothetical protein